MALLCAYALPGASQVPDCEFDDVPAFAGHSFPLIAEPGAVRLVEAYPDLDDFALPIFMAAEPVNPDALASELDRVYVVEQRGRILRFENRADVQDGEVVVFLDLSDRVHQSGFEQGLLGLAFDPDFWSNGFFYVNYTAPAAHCDGSSMCTRIMRFKATGSPPAVDESFTPGLLLEFEQPYSNHNGGMLAFGPDDLLYIGVGDGGSGGDPQNHAQRLGSILGSILRLDPKLPFPHIPPDNPFTDFEFARKEIFHFGIRNPWRMSFDRQTGDLWFGDVGQGIWEEINHVPAGGLGGLNFGWRRCEGNHPYSGGDCALNDLFLSFPVLEYRHDSNGGRSVTGGYVYRGSRAPSLHGAYVYGDYVSTRIWAWDRVTPTPLLISVNDVSSISSFAEDQNGELHVLSLGGSIHHFEDVEPGTGGGPPPELLSETGLFTDTAALVVAPGVIPYDVNAPLWSDRTRKTRWIAPPAGETLEFDATGAWQFPVGTALIKHFELEVAPGVFRRLETRVLIQQATGWVGYTYRWDDADPTDAFLLAGALEEEIPLSLPGQPDHQTWSYPGPSDCLGCHTEVGGRVLGVRTLQLNRSFDYTTLTTPGGTVENQLVAWSCMGLLDTPVEDPSLHGAYLDIELDTGSRNERVRSHLASNCEFCHQPGGPSPGGLDLRYATPLDAMHLVGVEASEGDLGIEGALRIAPASPESSVLWLRLASTDAAVRMAKGTRLPHPAAVSEVADWIAEDLPDDDADGVRNFEDNCPTIPNGPLAGPHDQLDHDGDGLGDVCECSYVEGVPMISDADFNRDGVVDGADYTIWADHFGAQDAGFMQGDASCDGRVDGGDYTRWADLYGTRLGDGGAARSTATPACGLGCELGFVLVGGAALRSRRRRS